MTDLTELARENAAKAFDEAYKSQVSMSAQAYQMTAIERAHLRKLITSHPAWPQYRSEWSIDASALDTRRVKHFCETRGLDWHVELVRYHESENQADEAARTTINDRAAQAEAAAKAARDADIARAKADMAREEKRVADAIKSTVIPTPPKAATSTVPTFSGDGIVNTIAGAMWAPMLDAIKADMNATLAKAIGELPTARIVVQRADGSEFKVPATHHPMLPTLIKMAAARMRDGRPVNIWIAGPTGSGKSHACEQVAEALGVPFHVQGAMSQGFELTGFIDAGGHYHDTPFRRAFEHGGAILLDEIDAGANEAMLTINGATANGGYSFPDRYVKRHPDCVIIGAANTWGTGPSAEYVGRSKIDNAVLSRFPVKLAWDYDTALEVRLSGNEAWARRVQDARSRARTNNVKHLIDPRHTYAGAALIASGFTADDAAKFTYLVGLSTEQVRMIEGRSL